MRQPPRPRIRTSTPPKDNGMAYGWCLNCGHTLHPLTLEEIQDDGTRQPIGTGIHCPQCEPLEFMPVDP